MDFNQLITLEESKLTNEQAEFLNLHNDILRTGTLAANTMIEWARKLKRMRDSRKWKVSFDSFGQYCENACGIKERQAYNYISVVENLSNDFLQANANLSMSKLITLASMDNINRQDMLTDHADELEEMSTREVDKLKKDYENRVQQLQLDLDTASKAKTASDMKVDEIKAELAQKNVECNNLEFAKKALEDRVAELEETAGEIAVKEDTESKEQLQRAIQEKEKIEAILKQTESERDYLQKKLDISSDSSMATFAVKFDDLQRLGDELLDALEQMSDDKRNKCKAAVKAVVAGWQL